MKPKKLPRLWCALQGLLPLEACLAAQRAELAWPREPTATVKRAFAGATSRRPRRNDVAVPAEAPDVWLDGPV